MSQIRDWGPIRTRLASFLERSMADQANQLVMLCMMYDISTNCVRGRLELGKLFLFQLKFLMIFSFFIRARVLQAFIRCGPIHLRHPSLPSRFTHREC